MRQLDKAEYTTELIKNVKSNYVRMIILAVLGFLSSILFARILGPEKYGIYTYMIWFIGIFTTLFGLGLSNTITKFLPEYYSNKQYSKIEQFLKTTLIIEVFCIIIGSILLVTTFPIWKIMIRSIEVENVSLVIILTSVNILPFGILLLFESTVQSIRRFDIYSKISLIGQVVVFLLNLIIVLLFRKIEYMLIALFISSVCQIICYGYFIKRKSVFKNDNSPNLKIDEYDRKRISKYAGYMYINCVSQQIIFARSEFIFMGIYSGPNEIASYGIAFSLVNLFGLIFSPVMNVLNNYFSSMVAKKEFFVLESIIQKVTRYFIIVLLLILTLIFAFSERLITILYSDQYGNVGIDFLIMATGFVIIQGLGVATSIPYLYEKQRAMVKLVIVVGLINIGLDAILIPEMGSIGAAISNTVSQTIVIIISFIYIKKITKFDFKLKKLIPCLLLSIIAILLLCYSGNIIYRIMITVFYIVLYIKMLYSKKIINVDEIKEITNQLKMK